MAEVTLGGNPASTIGSLPAVGTALPAFSLVKTDLSDLNSADLAGKNVVLNIFPSVGTGVCAASVREFNKRAAGLEDTVVICVSKDLPFAQKEFCGAEGIENVEMGSDFRESAFGKTFGVTMNTGGFNGLLARAVVVADKNGNIVHSELVPEIGNEPNYDAALAAL